MAARRGNHGLCMYGRYGVRGDWKACELTRKGRYTFESLLGTRDWRLRASPGLPWAVRATRAAGSDPACGPRQRRCVRRGLPRTGRRARLTLTAAAAYTGRGAAGRGMRHAAARGPRRSQGAAPGRGRRGGQGAAALARRAQDRREHGAARHLRRTRGRRPLAPVRAPRGRRSCPGSSAALPRAGPAGAPGRDPSGLARGQRAARAGPHAPGRTRRHPAGSHDDTRRLQRSCARSGYPSQPSRAQPLLRCGGEAGTAGPARAARGVTARASCRLLPGAARAGSCGPLPRIPSQAVPRPHGRAGRRRVTMRTGAHGRMACRRTCTAADRPPGGSRRLCGGATLATVRGGLMRRDRGAKRRNEPAARNAGRRQRPGRGVTRMRRGPRGARAAAGAARWRGASRVGVRDPCLGRRAGPRRGAGAGAARPSAVSAGNPTHPHRPVQAASRVPPRRPLRHGAPPLRRRSATRRPYCRGPTSLHAIRAGAGLPAAVATAHGETRAGPRWLVR